MAEKLRVAFAGSPDFAVPALQAISEQPDMILSLVITQPDRPAGRGLSMQPSAVKLWCEQRGMTCYQPTKSDHALADKLQQTDTDFLVVAAFGQLLREEVLAAVSGRCLNIHASLLPQWRGASPVQSSIWAGDNTTGVSIMQMVKALDAGPVLHQVSVPIGDMNAGQLMSRLASVGGEAVIQVMRDYAALISKAQTQDESLVTWAPKLHKAQAQIDWQQPRAAVLRQIRAFNPNPVAFSVVDGLRVRVYEAVVFEADYGGASWPPGSIVRVGAAGMLVACGDGCLLITTFQWAGAKVLRCPLSGTLPQKLTGLQGQVFSVKT